MDCVELDVWSACALHRESLMKRQQSEDDKAAINALRERALLTINYFANIQDFPLAFMYRENIEKAAQSGNLRKMRLMARDVDEMAIGLAPHEREGLEAILRERLGVDKEAERAALSQQVARTLQR